MTKRRNPKTKEQIASDIKRVQEILRQKQLANDTFIPILQKHDVTIYQAGQTLDILRNVIMGKMNAHWDDKIIKDLGLAEELTKDKEAKDRNIYADLITSFEDKTITDIMKILDTFGKVIEMYGHRHVMLAKFKDLPVDEILKN